MDYDDEDPHSLPTVEQQKVTAALQDHDHYDASSNSNSRSNNGNRSSNDWYRNGSSYWSAYASKHRKRILFAGIGIVVCLIGIIVLSTSLHNNNHNNNNNNNNNNPSVTMSAETKQRYDAVVDYLSGFDGVLANRQALTTSSTPQYKAAVWMAQDAYVPIPSTDVIEEAFPFVQRYVLAVFYYSLAGPAWKIPFSFLNHTSACDWYETIQDPNNIYHGVQCDAAGHVTDIYLSSNGLLGQIPTELRLLPYLQRLSLFGNQISGTIPSHLQTLDDLTFMSLANNALTGSIPSWLNSMSRLSYLGLGNNRFAGALPALTDLSTLRECSLEGNALTSNVHGAFHALRDLTKLFLANNQFKDRLDDNFFTSAPHLRELDLSFNQLQGSVPSHLLSHLILLDLQHNSLTGSLPNLTAIATDAPPLQYLSLAHNNLSGSIDTGIGNFVELTHLDVSYNALTGTLPSALNSLTGLQFLLLGPNNNLTRSSIPDLSSLTNLTALSLARAQLTGTLTNYIGQDMPRLQLLSVEGNHLTGTIPASLESLTDCRYLLLNNNNFSSSIPNSLRKLSNLETFAIHQNAHVNGSVNVICDGNSRHSVSVTASCNLPCSCCSKCCGTSNCPTDVLSTINSTLYGDGYSRDHTIVFSEDTQYVLPTDH